MATEIERKFLVKNDAWKSQVTARSHIRQGYLAVNDKVSIRIRIRDGHPSQVTIKSGSTGLSRSEYEYDIPPGDAEELMTVCGDHMLEKHRHLVPQGDLTWEVDVFSAPHEGLVIAEIEIPAEDHAVDLPDWLGEEVTGDPAYNNSSLSSPDFRPAGAAARR